jgi:hypothetical protein
MDYEKAFRRIWDWANEGKDIYMKQTTEYTQSGNFKAMGESLTKMVMMDKLLVLMGEIEDEGDD